MDDFIYKVIAGILMVVVFGYLGVNAWQCDLGMIGAICFGIAAKGIILPIMEYLDYTKQKRQAIIRKIYKIPSSISYEYGEVWDRELQKVIAKAIGETTDSAKIADLKHCQRVAKAMIKDSTSYRLDRPFYKINNAFRLTGCHFTITDSQGKTITKIV